MNTLQETLVRPVHQVGLYFLSAEAAKGGVLGVYIGKAQHCNVE